MYMTETEQLIEKIWKQLKLNIERKASVLKSLYSEMELCATEQLLCQQNPKEETKHCLLETDGNYIYYVPKAILKAYKERNLEQLETELFHIFLHKLLGHCEMRDDLKNEELFDICADMEVHELMQRLNAEEDTYVQVEVELLGSKESSKENQKVLGNCRERYIYYRKKIQSGQETIAKLKQRYQMQCVDDHQRWKKGYEEKERNSFNNTQKVKLGFENDMSEEDSFQIESSCKQKAQQGNQSGNQPGSQQQSMNLIQEDDSKFEKILKQLVQVEETNKENDEQFDKALYCFGFEQYGDVAFIEPCEDTEDKKKFLISDVAMFI